MLTMHMETVKQRDDREPDVLDDQIKAASPAWISSQKSYMKKGNFLLISP